MGSISESASVASARRARGGVGAKAYASGRYDVAIEAFEEAYAIAAKPAIVFSLAQAERKHYFATKDARYLRRAAEHFRKYLADDGAGARRADATDTRRVRVALTPAGQRHVAPLLSAARAHEAQRLQALGAPELERMRKALHALVQHFDEQDGPRPDERGGR